MATFKHLFSPFKIGGLELRNRVFMSPHGMVGLGIGTDAQVDYFDARAKGGCGFMVIASCQVVPAPQVPPGWFIEAYNRDHIPAIRRLSMRCTAMTARSLSRACGCRPIHRPDRHRT